MFWLPEPLSLAVLLGDLESGVDAPTAASTFAWNCILNPFSTVEFRDRLQVIRGLEEKRDDETGFLNSETRQQFVAELEKPGHFADWLSNRVDAVTKRFFRPYEPDEIPDPEDTYCYAHLQAGRAALLLKSEPFGEETLYAVDESLTSLARLDLIARREWGVLIRDWPVRLLSTFLLAARYKIEREKGDFESAIKTLASTADAYYDAVAETNVDFDPKPINVFGDPDVDIRREMLEIRRYIDVPEPFRPDEMDSRFGWMTEIEPESVKECFTAIKLGPPVHDFKELAQACHSLADWELAAVAGFSGRDDVWVEFWAGAAGWCDAQVTPSDLRDLLREREESAAVDRLRTYFFRDGWHLIPLRAQRALVNVDRTINHHTHGRFEALLNELRIATDEFLWATLWNPLSEWVTNRRMQDPEDLDFQGLLVKISETNNGENPSLRYFGAMLRTHAFRTWIEHQHLAEPDIQFLRRDLSTAIRALQQRRNSAEHDLGDQIPTTEVTAIFDLFLGIGGTGILPGLLRIGARIGALIVVPDPDSD